MRKNRGFQGPPLRQADSDIKQKLQQALGLHQRQMLPEASKLYEEILKQAPDHFDALHLLGAAACQMNDLDRGVQLIGKAIKINPNDANAHFNHGNGLRELGRFEDALASYDAAIRLKPDHAAAYWSRGSAFMSLNRPDEALASYDRAISLRPDFVEAHVGRGIALAALKRPGEALGSYDKSIALTPNNATAYYNRGNALVDLDRADEALASFDKAIALKPDYGLAYINRGNVLNAVKRFNEALVRYDKAVAIAPDATALNNRGNALSDLGRLDEALASYDSAIALRPDYAEAYHNRGRVLTDLRRLEEAFLAYDRALSLKPELAGAEGMRLHAKLKLCDWADFDEERVRLWSLVRRMKPSVGPFDFLAISSSPDDQLKCAKVWVAEKFPPWPKALWQGERYRHDRIRVAYVTADFREHPVALLMAGMLECHDRTRFDVTAISLGADDRSETRGRLKSCLKMIDAEMLGDGQIANIVKSSEVDILVDLMGFTANSRTGIFARRPAPIQVNYLGYAGTMGAAYIDYILADRIVIPEEERECYSEKVVHLPDCFMPSDSSRKISELVPRRSECGLPDTDSCSAHSITSTRSRPTCSMSG